MNGFIERLIGTNNMRPKSGKYGNHCYSGRYHGGRVTYYYDDSEIERIYQGKYRYSRKSYEGSLEKTTIRACGNFDEDLKSGRWKYQSKRKREKKVLIIDYERGIYNGVYIYKSWKGMTFLGWKKRSKRLSMRMHNGHPIGEIKGNLGRDKFKGNFDEEGNPHGLWVMDIKTDGNKTCYEEWEHGDRKEFYSISRHSGNRIESDPKITVIIENFIYRECTNLERIEPKGCALWKGNFKI
ncbi:MAG: hypothetical protein LUC91_02680 [Prevotella sp.]|nr:hypothetical protein [Prevotella sp.]